MSKRTGISILAVILVGAIAGLGGYLLGHGEAPTKNDAVAEEKAAFGVAFKTSFPEARESGEAKGRKIGLQRGQLAGEKQGFEKGKSIGIDDVSQEQARLAAEAAAAEAAALAAQAAEATALYGTNIPPDAPSACPPGYHFEGGDACVPD